MAIANLVKLGTRVTLRAPRKARRERGQRIDGCEALCAQLTAAGIEHVREFKFHPQRNWKIDIAIPAGRIALEYEGYGKHGSAGRHQRPGGFRLDTEKYAEIAIAKWFRLSVERTSVFDGRALEWIQRALSDNPGPSTFEPMRNARRRRIPPGAKPVVAA